LIKVEKYMWATIYKTDCVARYCLLSSTDLVG